MLHKKTTTIASLALIMSCRMLGLFMILPVLSLYAEKLPHATPTLIGIALGIYGLTQACLQMPFGSLSDRIGRKQVITIGLILFAIGSVIAAISANIYLIILGRAIQGTGAIGSTILAMVADLTRDEDRSKAMAIIGLAIGLSFAIAMVIGPLINAQFHLSGIFWVTTLLALISLGLLHTIIPNLPKLHVNSNATSPKLFHLLKNKELLKLDFGILTSHAILTASFIAIPILLTQYGQLSENSQTIIYLAILTGAFFSMLPFIILAEKKRKIKPIFLSAIIVITLSQVALLIFHQHLNIIIIALYLFFTAFTLLEATLPSLVSKIAPIKRKGTAMGIYSTSQFLGIFIGGSCGGWIFSNYNINGLFIFCSIMGLIWLSISWNMTQPPFLSTIILKASNAILSDFQTIQNRLLANPGVSEVAIMPHEALLYLKIDKQLITKDELRKLINKSNLHE